MKFNTPLPQTLPKECTKAAKICEYLLASLWATIGLTLCPVSSFVDNKNNGLDGVSIAISST
jgi:hypothetical protein